MVKIHTWGGALSRDEQNGDIYNSVNSKNKEKTPIKL